MQIWKKDQKGRWVARQSHSLHQLHHRMSLTQFILRQSRSSTSGIFIIFTDGEVDSLVSDFNRYLVEKKNRKWCRITKAVNMLISYVRHLQERGIATAVVNLPQHNAHDFEEKFEIVPTRRCRRYVGIYAGK